VIEIEAALDPDGVLRACKASGHAKAGKEGTDIVCAAVSFLLGTAFKTISGRKGISVRGDAPEKGQFWLEADYEAEGKEFLSTAGIFLLEGLKSISQEYPKNCKLTIRQF